eukprot:Amastigsp_a847374_24.p1 type:complete len:1065 gc:universal Amastigsp_a847374_24:38-3232(+)
MAAATSAVQIAVRMRPFNEREKKLGTAKCVEMVGQMCTATDPENGQAKSFSFTYCYDSFDENDPNYASQERVFNDLGRSYLENAWAGYNCSIFAYGQTGAGKSYSMTGYGNQLGIIPRGLREMFDRIKSNTDESLSYRVEVSYLEIYMEKIRDLFSASSAEGNLKIRESPKLGIYVEGLKKERVSSYEDVERLMELGNTMRTVAQTNMNATSSRSHSVLTVLLTQTRVNHENMTASDTTSKINLIDLAGSERQAKTGAEGDRLKEGSAINQSLTALGNVIEALAELSTNKGKAPASAGKGAAAARIVPYRDSKLTRILQESLGGNAKTIMVAAISPAADNFKETLSTLRYANRASKIENVAIVNEEPNEKVIRELKEEVQRLRDMLAAGGGSAGGAVLSEEEMKKHEEMAAELAALRAQLDKQTEYIADMTLSKEERSAKQHAASSMTAVEMAEALKAMHGIDIDVDTSLPHLVNLHNPSLLYGLNKPVTVFGKAAECDIKVGGVLIQNLHCSLKNTNGVFTLEPHASAPVFLDGKKLDKSAVLQEGDRIVIGNNHFFRFVDPAEVERLLRSGNDLPSLHYDLHYAVNELAANNPLTKIQRVEGETEAQARRRGELELVLTDLLPFIMEANAIAKAMNRQRQFEPVFACDMSNGLALARTEIQIKVVHLDDLDVESYWATSRFEEALYEMKEIYNAFNETGVGEPSAGDPFLDPPRDKLIGLAHVLLLPLSEGLCVGPNLHTPIWDRAGAYQGGLMITIFPATVTGDDIKFDDIADDWLRVGARVDFAVTIVSVLGVPLAYSHGVYCKYRFSGLEFVYTPPSRDQIVNHEFNHRHIVTTVATEALIRKLQEGELVVEVWACPDPEDLPVFQFQAMSADRPQSAPQFIAETGGEDLDRDTIDASFMVEMMERMKPQHFAAGQYVMREGDEGNCMYFLTRGVVVVELPTKETVQINEGTFFGEIALFMNCKRTASVRAYNEVDVLILSRDTFDDVISKWPDVKAQFEALAEQHLESDRKRAVRGSKVEANVQWMKRIANIMHKAIVQTAEKKKADAGAGAAGASTS